MARLNINLVTGVLEVEGEEQFIREVYADFKDRIRAGQAHERAQDDRDVSKPNVQKNDGKRAGGKRDYVEINKNLDVYGKSGKKPLAEFYKEKAPSTAVERNAVFVYYLSRILEHSPITMNDVYTCYSAVGAKAPNSFRQSLWDTSSNKYGYIDTKNIGDIRIPIKGAQFVEHDLPNNKKSE